MDDASALKATVKRLQAENRNIHDTLETLYRPNHELKQENDNLMRQRDDLLDRLNHLQSAADNTAPEK